MISPKQKHCCFASTEKMADALKALGHPVRLRMVQELTEFQSCCCADLCACFPQSQATISQHLSVLKDAGIISYEKHGNKSCFSLNHDVLQEIQTAMNALVIHKTSGAQREQ